jgi:hypothetical protein
MAEWEMNKHEAKAIQQLTPQQNYAYNEARCTKEEREARKAWFAAMTQRRKAEAEAQAAELAQQAQERREEEQRRQLAKLPPVRRWLTKLFGL